MDKRLQKLFAKYNERFWNGDLPPTTVMWAELKETAKSMHLGLTRAYRDAPFVIQLNPKLKNVGWEMVKFVLLHEMCHVALFPNFQHGKKFNNEMKRLAAAGAFDGIW